MMGRPGSSSCWVWLMAAALVLRAKAEPQFLVVVPAVVESGSEARFCLSLMKVTEDVSVTVSLESGGRRTLLYERQHHGDTHTCRTFQAPSEENLDMQIFETVVRGKGFYRNETRKILIQDYGVRTLIQTDRPMYLPGQTVHFRLLTLDSRLRPVPGAFDVIEVKDPPRNRMAQWLNRSTGGGILQLSHQLPPEAREGHYILTATGPKSSSTQSFMVQKYVLPKFSVEIKAPAEVSIALGQVPFQVCARYTFGRPVSGSVEAEMCRLLESHRANRRRGRPNPICHKEQQKQTGTDGCASFLVETAPFKNDTLRLDRDYTVRAKVTEAGTDLGYAKELKIQLSYRIGKVEFVDPPEQFCSGDVLDVKVRAVHFSDTPVTDTTVHLKHQGQALQSLQTDLDGLAVFRVNTSGFSQDVTLQATLYTQNVATYRRAHFGDAFASLSKIKPLSPHTRTPSSLKVLGGDRILVCGAEEVFTVRYTFIGESLGAATIMYLVLSRGVIVKHGHYGVHVDTEEPSEMTFTLEILPDMAPGVTVVTYAVLPSESVIAASRDFKTEKCFSNKVSLEFSPSSSVPGEDSSLKVSAAPRSLCGLSAVDQSVLIKEPGKTLEPDNFFRLLPVPAAQGFPDHLEDPLGCVKVRDRRALRSSVPYPGHDRKPRDKNDVYHVLKKNGLKMATNLFIRIPSCVNYRGTEFHLEPLPGFYPQMGMARGGLGGGFDGGGQALTPVEIKRTFFPETWIWDLVEVGESGTVALAVTVPDTITTWETDALCLSPQGVGLAPRQQLTVFQPFFLELSLPYSIIRGESFELRATVFNYLPSCIMIMVTPAPSADFTLTPLSGDQYTSCLCGSETKTLSWAMLPSALGVVNVTVRAEAITSQVQCDNEVMSVPDRGRVDVVTKPLRVKAEGTEVVKTLNWLLCPKGEVLKEQVELSLPEYVIPGSARASVSVLGDILGRALKNLDGLLQMPFGCGEQNMALLAPNIYILQYLQKTQQLSLEVKERALKFLSSGYQRQLNYKHQDGSYSAFGRGDGNTWLTAFVLRCFSKAQAFVYIDPQKLDKSRVWLQKRQKEDGCFQPSGKLFNNRMKGGVSDAVTLSAYITAAFLETNASDTDPVVERGLSCLRNISKSQDNVYTTALLAYVFSLSGDSETRAQLQTRLRSQATEEGGLVHWSSSSSSSSSSSLSVETSAYVLLSLLTQPQLGAEDLGYASKIVRWLMGQQNAYGGFQSTQDTVVALQALALYSTLVYSPDGSSSVVVHGLSGSLPFVVDKSNKLLYQERPLGGAAGQYSLEVTGSACVSVQISSFYNIPTPREQQSLGVLAEAQMDCNSTFLILTLTVRYLGDLSSSNMIILDVKALSGFIPDQRALEQLEIAFRVDRVEQQDDHVLIYIRELSKDQPVSYRLRLGRQTSVENLKPAVVRIYDYYAPGDQAETDYTSPCAQRPSSE